jgi:hypothetical protein
MKSVILQHLRRVFLIKIVFRDNDQDQFSGLLGFWTLFIIWYSRKTQKNTTFRKPDLFPSGSVRKS